MGFCTDIKPVKETRKKHECVFCRKIIPTGKGAFCWTFFEDRESRTLYSCIPCKNWKLVDSDECYDDGCIAGTIADAYEGTCPDCKGELHIRKYLEAGNLLLGCSRCDYEKTFEYGWE